MTSVLRTKALSKFSCLGDKCSDNCCSDVWTVDVDAATLERYRKEAPELLDALVQKGDDWSIRKDKTHSCVKLEGGICSIHKNFGDRMLGDTCHFFPRKFAEFPDQIIVTATPACPEIIRLALEDPEACFFEPADMERLPVERSPVPIESNAEYPMSVHRAFLEAALDPKGGIEKAYARIAHVIRIFCDDIPPFAEMPEKIKSLLERSDAELPEPVLNPADAFNLLHAMFAKVAQTRSKSDHSRQLINDIEKAMGVKLDWVTMRIHADMNSQISYQLARNDWRSKWHSQYDERLRRWLALQLSSNLFPFLGAGRHPVEMITFIGVRLAMVKLALMCACHVRGEALPPEDTVRLMLHISRITDHLNAAKVSATIYAEPGWDNEARMRGLLEI